MEATGRLLYRWMATVEKVRRQWHSGRLQKDATVEGLHKERA